MANDILMSLLSPEQRSQAQEDAFRQGLLGLSQGLIRAAIPQGGRRTSTLEALALAAPGAVQSYRGSFDQTLKDLLTNMQVKDMMAKREREANFQKAIQGAYTTQPKAGLGLGVEQLANRITQAEIEAFGPDAYAQAAMTAAPMERTLDRNKALEALAQYGGTEGLGTYLTATKPVESPETFRTLSADEAKALGLPPGSYQMSNRTKKVSTIGGGGVSVYNYPPGALPAGKEAGNQLDEMLMSSGRRAQTLSQIQNSFKPEYLAIPFRGQQAWSTLKDKFGGLPEDQKRTLGEYSAFRQNVVDNLNRTIKEITGAAMAESEAQRIIAGLPNAGTGIFDGDSPTEFQAKLENSVKQMKLVEARAVYMKKNGLSLKDIPLSNMPQIINDRAKQIAKQQGLDVNKPEDQMRIKMQLSSEFGITNQ